jgi:sulfite reductase (NADPH) hemoprotein beta-component
MAELTPVERIKRESRLLRGTLAGSLADQLTGAIAEDDQALVKFHGTYQQDDRDVREERRKQKLEPAYSFMIRTRLPGGVVTPQQWLALDAIATRYGNGGLRLTTRQAFQFHGVVKSELKSTMQAINAALIDTIAACGDVNRNVLAPPTPAYTKAREQVFADAHKVAMALAPQTKAYHAIWIDGVQLDNEAP